VVSRPGSSGPVVLVPGGLGGDRSERGRAGLARPGQGPGLAWAGLGWARGIGGFGGFRTLGLLGLSRATSDWGLRRYSNSWGLLEISGAKAQRAPRDQRDRQRYERLSGIPESSRLGLSRSPGFRGQQGLLGRPRVPGSQCTTTQTTRDKRHEDPC